MDLDEAQWLVAQIADWAPDFVGDSRKARVLILALIDQAGYKIWEQDAIAKLMNFDNIQE